MTSRSPSCIQPDCPTTLTTHMQTMMQTAKSRTSHGWTMTLVWQSAFHGWERVLSDKPIGWTTSKTTSHRNTWCCSTRYLIKLATVLFSDRFFTVVIELGHQYECLDQPKLWCKLPWPGVLRVKCTFLRFEWFQKCCGEGDHLKAG